MDSILKMEVWNWLDIQQSTGYNKRDRDEFGSRKRDESELRSLSGGFRCRLQNQSLIGKSNIRQFEWDSAINQQKGEPKNILIASAKKKTIVKIVISNFSVIETEFEKEFVEHV